jgi:hypothetical protein
MNTLKDFLNSQTAGHASPDYGPYILTMVGVFGNGQGTTSQRDIDTIKTSVNALAAKGPLAGANGSENWAERKPQ